MDDVWYNLYICILYIFFYCFIELDFLFNNHNTNDALNMNHDYMSEMFMVCVLNEIDTIKSILLNRYIQIPNEVPYSPISYKFNTLRDQQMNNCKVLDRLKTKLKQLNYMNNDEIWYNFKKELDENIRHIKFVEILNILNISIINKNPPYKSFD
jgi:hypothetical protein